jgi:hypothetical protein
LRLMTIQYYDSKEIDVKPLFADKQSKIIPARPDFVAMISHSQLPSENIPLNDSAREKLCELVQKNGLEMVCPGKIDAMLEKTCPGCRTEIDALVSAFRNGVAGDLMWNPSEEPRHVLFKRLVKRLQDNEGLLPRVAHWAVESWVLALSFVKWTPEQETLFGDGYSSTDVFPSQNNPAKTPRRWFF